MFNPVVNIGSYTSIAGDCLFIGDGNHASVINKNTVSNYPFFAKGYGFPEYHQNEPITIGSDVWIGTRSIIMNGANIGDGAIIGANSVVTGVVPPYAVYVGNQVHHYRFSKDIIDALLHIKWWEWTDATIKQRIMDFNDITLFVNKYNI